MWLSNRGHTGDTTLETLTDVLKKLDKIEPVPKSTGREEAAHRRREQRRSSAAKKAATRE